MITASLLLALAPAAAPQIPDEGELPVDSMLLVINDEVLTMGMVDRRAQRIAKVSPELAPEDVAGFALRAAIQRIIAQEGFRRLGMEFETIDRLVRMRMDDMQREDGSLARFEERIAADGYTIETMREAIREEYIYRAWQDIVTGREPSPTRGLRVMPEPTAEEIRAAYEDTPEQWQTARSMHWVSLSFMDGGETEALETAQALRAALARGETTLEEVRAQATSVREASGDPAGMPLRSDLASFLEEAQPGDASGVTPIRGLGGQFVVLTERRGDREISFQEAQVFVKERLMRDRAFRVEMEELARLLDSSYVWSHPMISNFLQQLRAAAGAEESEEL